MEKYIIIAYDETDETLNILGHVNLPETLNKSTYIINVNENIKVIKPIFDNYIYGSNINIKVLLCEEYKNNRNINIPNNIPNYGQYSKFSHILKEPLSNEGKINFFMNSLIHKKIDLKAYFRKEKIEKILEE